MASPKKEIAATSENCDIRQMLLESTLGKDVTYLINRQEHFSRLREVHKEYYAAVKYDESKNVLILTRIETIDDIDEDGTFITRKGDTYKEIVHHRQYGCANYDHAPNLYLWWSNIYTQLRGWKKEEIWSFAVGKAAKWVRTHDEFPRKRIFLPTNY